MPGLPRAVAPRGALMYRGAAAVCPPLGGGDLLLTLDDELATEGDDAAWHAAPSAGCDPAREARRLPPSGSPFRLPQRAPKQFTLLSAQLTVQLPHPKVRPNSSPLLHAMQQRAPRAPRICVMKRFSNRAPERSLGAATPSPLGLKCTRRCVMTRRSILLLTVANCPARYGKAWCSKRKALCFSLRCLVRRIIRNINRKKCCELPPLCEMKQLLLDGRYVYDLSPVHLDLCGGDRGCPWEATLSELTVGPYRGPGRKNSQ